MYWNEAFHPKRQHREAIFFIYEEAVKAIHITYKQLQFGSLLAYQPLTFLFDSSNYLMKEFIPLGRRVSEGV
jgi:hypothetical protein